MEFLRGRVECRHLVSLLEANPRNEVAICECVRQLSFSSALHRGYLQRLACSPSEILLKWDLNRELAAREGTWMHFTFEAFLNRAAIDESAPEFHLFRS